MKDNGPRLVQQEALRKDRMMKTKAQEIITYMESLQNEQQRKIWPNNQKKLRQITKRDTANCHIKNQPTATSRISQLSHR